MIQNRKGGCDGSDVATNDMALFRPGDFDITDRGIEIAGLEKGSRCLDIGCGEGDTVAHLVEDMGIEAEGIDMNLSMISRAKEKHPGINVKFGDGEFLDDYMSFTFDGVLMECVLSLINIPDEALHEAYCVLKKGGKLIISDLYHKNPDPKQMKAVEIEAERLSRIPHKEGDCEDSPKRFVDFKFEGAFYEAPLKRQLEEIGYEVVAFEDRSRDLDGFIAGYLMDGGKLEDLMTEVKPENSKDIGYFLLVAEKPM